LGIILHVIIYEKDVEKTNDAKFYAQFDEIIQEDTETASDSIDTEDLVAENETEKNISNSLFAPILISLVALYILVLVV